MTRIALFSGTARVAISGLLLGASTIAVAQETAPVIEPLAAPVVAPAPAPVTVAPEPVSTPTPVTEADDSIAPAALSDIALERAAQREAASERAASVRSQRQTAVPVRVTNVAQSTAAIAPDSTDVAIDPSDAGVTNDVVDVEPIAQAPIDNDIATSPTPADDNINDWLLIAGVVGAAGLAGGAALAANRRRRRVVKQPADTRATARPLATLTPETKSWAAMPVSDPAPARAPVTVAAPLVAEKPATFAPSSDPVFARQPAGPISADPLFAPRNVPEIPVTDPLFSRKIEVPPVTDPMFAHLPEFEGNGRNAEWSFDARRNWVDKRQAGNTAARELEPAE